MKFNFKSRKGFTLIELLVVIGILAVLAAIAIPSVAGLIDRANVSADKTNSNEMTNALERFTSEYELYCQDIASGTLDPDNLDSTQGRVKNVIGVTTRSGIEDLEIGQGETVADDVVAIYRDTKYPVNATTIKKVIENYTKTSSSTFEPKQSDMHYWYSPDCGVVVVAEPTKTAAELDKYVISGMDAKGNDITSDSINAKWIDITANTPSTPAGPTIITFHIRNVNTNEKQQFEAIEGMTWSEWVESEYGDSNYQYSARVGSQPHQVSLFDATLSSQGNGTCTLVYRNQSGLWIRVYTCDTINPELDYAFVPLSQSSYPAD